VASRPSRGSAGKPVPLIQRIVSAWPRAVDGRHVEALGFTADTGIDEVVEAFIEDDLEMQKRFACATDTLMSPSSRHDPCLCCTVAEGAKPAVGIPLPDPA
jgi:hypothetical protein